MKYERSEDIMQDAEALVYTFHMEAMPRALEVLAQEFEIDPTVLCVGMMIGRAFAASSHEEGRDLGIAIEKAILTLANTVGDHNRRHGDGV